MINSKSFEKKHLLFLIPLLLWPLYMLIFFRGLRITDVLYYVEVGRNILAGEGVISRVVSPLEVGLFGKLIVPQIIHAPLYFYILAGLQLISDSEIIILIFHGFCYWGTVLLIYWIGKNKLHDERIGMAAALSYALNWEILTFTINGMTENILAFLMLVLFYCIFSWNSDKKQFWSGAVLGATYMVKQSNIVCFPVVIMYFLLTDYGDKKILIKKTAFFTAGFIIAALPEFYRNYIYTGSPAFLFSYSHLMYRSDLVKEIIDDFQMSFHGWERMISHPYIYILKNPGFMIKKVLSQLGEFYRDFLSPARLLGFDFLPLFNIGFIASLFLCGKKAEDRKFVWILASPVLIFFLIVMTHWYTKRYFFPFYPLIFLLGYYSLNRFLSPRLGRRGLAVILTVTVLCSGFITIRKVRSRLKYGFNPFWTYLDRRYEAMQEFLGTYTAEDDFVLSDFTHHVAYFANRFALSLPNERELDEIGDYVQPKAIVVREEGNRLIQKWKELDKYQLVRRVDDLEYIGSNIRLWFYLRKDAPIPDS